MDPEYLVNFVSEPMIWFYFFIILLGCPNTTIASNKSCFHKEKQALLHFKVSIHDPNGQLSTWKLEDDDCCKWIGVTCNNQTRHVTRLHLSTDLEVALVGLGGEISRSLLNLSYLNHLDLSSNSFDGTIPNFIGSMTKLRHLDLSFNSFNGTIPMFIGSMAQLRYLDVSFNAFNGKIPPELGNLTNLRYLSVGTNERSCKVENLDWLSNLSHLRHLNMFRISLAKANQWVDVILSLRKLSFLSLEGCDLSKVMHPYSSFVNSSYLSIEFLSFRDNNLNSSMYGWLFPLTSNRLVSLDLSGNMLNGIPKYIGNLCSLTSLTFSSNSAIVNLTESLNNLSGCITVTLQEFDASYNQLIGPWSDEIQKFSSLQSLILSHSHLSGSMSEKVWELPNLQSLDVSSNSLIIFSNNIGKSKLWYMDLSNNSLVVTPSKPHMLNISYVEQIHLSVCNLGPFFPKWIQTHKNLTYLDLSNNRISDVIPVEFWKTWPSRLTYLDLSSNNISGELPDLTSNFDLYSVIDLSSNNFYGPISKVPPTLLSLNLSKNKFYGGISFICQIVDGFLSFLDLSHNFFTGQLPDCLWQFKELRVLNLAQNNLSGRLPASIGYANQLEVLHLYSNNFFGELPVSLKNCTNLMFLNMGGNKFFDEVPIWVGENLTRLYVLSLRSNKFFGTVPLQICHLINLRILDLSINNLGGTIPSCVNNLNAMVNGRFLQEQIIHHPLTQDYNVPNLELEYVDNAIIMWQGNEHEFINNLGFNNLAGQIPNELTDLHELLALNLSKNELLGEFPRKIGEMKKLLTLDLSRNNFSGAIPLSMSQMASLNYLDMSHNSLSGRIPSSTQLQSFPPSRYIGNAGLCGPPLLKNCPGDEVSHDANKNESGEEGTDEELQRWFYIGGSTGFATGFWIACGTLLLNRRGRHVFFHFLDFVKDWVYVKVVVFVRKLERVAHT
ncbi:hypothetical protein OSB04_017412 [Centaurea solstitialis]|uniref:Leucine-rich repeat-containing N-terminal plant-type domain-containing protein n=1 Tax=Centaurea solstitialis TaxID=347529 RepID=A0AA38WAN8_9ASTR|nr:hypothetical protein OSB04_017412 [Centaurea solstitialis]